MVSLLPSASVSFLFLGYITAMLSCCVSRRAGGTDEGQRLKARMTQGAAGPLLFFLIGLIGKYYSLKLNI